MWKHTSLSLLFGCFACGGEEAVFDLPAEEIPSVRDQTILALANDRYVGVEELDHGVELDVRAAMAIIDRRPFETIESLDRTPFVGPAAMEKMFRYASAHGYLAAYRPPPAIEMPARDDVRYDEPILLAALSEARITDAGAVLTRAKLRFDDGDRMLDYEELAAAAISCRDDIWAIDGYRFAESVVDLMLETFELEDRLALIAAGTAHDEDGNRYLTLHELERARLDLRR